MGCFYVKRYKKSKKNLVVSNKSINFAADLRNISLTIKKLQSMIKSIDKSLSVTNRSLSLSIYFGELNKRSIKKNKMNELYVKYYETKSEKYKNEIICANAKFVVSLAKQYQHMGLDLDDLISDGNIGLIKAVELYDPTKDNTFLSFAIHYIRKYINIALNEKSRVVRLPFNRICEGDSLSSSSLDASVGGDDDDHKTFGDMLSGDMNANDYDNKDYNEKAIKHIFSLLTDREKYIISKLYGIGCRQCTKCEIAIDLRISEERVRQLSLSIIEKIRKAY